MVFNQTGQLVEHTLDGVSQPLTPAIQPAATVEWPVWAKALKQFATPEDKGIGDVIARIIGSENSEAFKSWHIATFGRPCGCNGRQKRLNILYPLNE